MTTGSGSASSRKWLVLGLGLSVLFNVGFAVAFVVRLVGFPPPPPPEGGPHPHEAPSVEQPLPTPPGGPARLKERLGLSEELARELHEDRMAMAGKIRELRARAREEKAQLFRMVATDGTELEALKERTVRIAALQRDVQDIVVEHLVALRGKLDVEQRKKFDEFVGTDLCGCPMCDGGCMGERGQGRRQGRGPHRGSGGEGGRHHPPPTAGIQPPPDVEPGNCAGSAPVGPGGGSGVCGAPGAGCPCDGGLGGLLE